MPLTKIIFYLMTVNSCFATTNFIFTYENEFRLKNQSNPVPLNLQKSKLIFLKYK